MVVIWAHRLIGQNWMITIGRQDLYHIRISALKLTSMVFEFVGVKDEESNYRDDKPRDQISKRAHHEPGDWVKRGSKLP